MGDLLGLIVPIAAIIFWVVGAASPNKDENNQQQRSQRPSTHPTRSRQETASQTLGKMEPTSVPGTNNRKDSFDSAGKETFQQQKERQMEAIQQQFLDADQIREYKGEQPEGEHNALKDKPVQPAYRRHNRQGTSLSISKNLTKKGIAQGIIMAEVLGPPRAYKKQISNRK